MNVIEISNKFPTELHAIEYLERKRWGRKPKCAYCKSENLSKRSKDYRYNCKACNKSFSVTVNTCLHNTRLPVRTWLFAFSIVTDAKKGLSALQLQRNLNVSYPTAWSMYMKIRTFMEEKIKQMDGIVEMDETYVGGKPRKANNFRKLDKDQLPKLDAQINELRKEGINLNAGKGNPAKIDLNPKRGRGTSKIPVVGIVQRDGSVVAQVMQSLTTANLRKMIEKHVDTEDAVLITDEYSGYNRISRIIEHVKIDHQKLYSYKGVNTNTIESFWAIVKRGIIGQYHQVSPKHLPHYITEFVFKYNNRKDDDMFDTLVKNALKPIN